ncbi:MAG: hypothetical protein VX498_13880 [Myxococcota bacterium]|nr:hypothetical protein [Myxococcota bacterium]
MTARNRAIAAVCAALALVVLILWRASEVPRRWSVVVVVVEAPVSSTPVATPRLDSLRRAGVEVPWVEDNSPPLDLLADQMLDRRWFVAPPLGSADQPAGLVVGQTLEFVYSDDGPSRGRKAFLRLHIRPVDRGEWDREFGRLVDGLAGPLRPARTLFVLVDRERESLVVGGPRNLRSVQVQPPEGSLDDWLAGLLRLPAS